MLSWSGGAADSSPPPSPVVRPRRPLPPRRRRRGVPSAPESSESSEPVGLSCRPPSRPESSPCPATAGEGVCGAGTCSGWGAATGAVALRRRGASVGAGGWNKRPKFWTAGAVTESGSAPWSTRARSTWAGSTWAGSTWADSGSRGAVADFLAVLRGARLAALRAGAVAMSAGAAAGPSAGSVAGLDAPTLDGPSSPCWGALAFLVALRGARLAGAFFTGTAVPAGSSGARPVLKMLSSLDAIEGVFPSST